jgi:hypothetical protein
MKFLPKIIFLESHADPTVKKTLTKLIPFLQHMGYEIYYDEYNVGKTLEESLFHWELQIGGQFLRSKLKIGKQDTLKEKDWTLAEKSFLENLKLSHIDYKPIDIKIPYTTEEEIIRYAKSKEGRRERDLNFSNQYLKEERGIFGINGYAHAPGIQENILKTMPKDKASSLFCFIHIFDPLDENDPNEEKLNESFSSLPLGCFIVNEPSRDVNSIAQAISTQIFKKHIQLYLEFFQAKAEGFRGNFIKAAEAADKLSLSVNNAITNHLEYGDFKTFKIVCMQAINEASIELEKHRGWKQLLADFASVIVSILTFGYFNFEHNLDIFGLFKTKTDSKIKLDSLDNTIEQMDKFRELETGPEYLLSENNDENALSI